MKSLESLLSFLWACWEEEKEEGGGSSAVKHLTRLSPGGLVCPGWYRDTNLAPCFLALQLVFLMPVCANRTFGNSPRGDDLLQTEKKAEPADSNKIPQMWNQDGKHLF